MKRFLSGSIFIKLLAIYGLAFLLIAVGAGVAHVFSSASPNIDISLDNVRYYTELIIDEIGDPPDIRTAERVAMEAGLKIAIFGPDIEWASEGALMERARSYVDERAFSRVIFQEVGDWMIQVRRGPYRYCFYEFHSDYRLTFFIWLLMSTVILSALAISYALVWKLLKPVRDMNRVALEFGVNDWKQRVNPKGRDELAVLGRTMDSMADRIEQYIKSIHDLLAAISHELRSPLTRMKVALEFIDDQRVKESLDEEIRGLDRLTGALLEQRRLSTQPGALHREPVALHVWIAEVLEPYRHAEVPVRLEIEGPEKTLQLDRARMDLALRNLVENAFRHAPGSPVTVSLRAETNDGDAFTVEVSDEGPGMPDDLLSRVGEPFLLVDPSRSGSRLKGGFGLGLSIVRAVAEAHGAVFSVRNRSPHGLSVTLDFRTRG
jgi:signal transduction histidine kinase